LGKRVLILLAKLAAGYVIAVLVAAFVSIFCMFTLITLMNDGNGPVGSDLGIAFGMAIVLTAMFAWPGYLITLWSAYKFKRPSYAYFGIGGVLTTALALTLFSGPRNHLNELTEFSFAYVGGAAGGLAYAWFHQRVFKSPSRSES